MFGRRTNLTPEQEVTERQIRELKRLRRVERNDRLREQLGWVFKNSFPKGIRHPDSTVKNIHLYVPGGKRRTNLR